MDRINSQYSQLVSKTYLEQQQQRKKEEIVAASVLTAMLVGLTVSLAIAVNALLF